MRGGGKNFSGWPEYIPLQGFELENWITDNLETAFLYIFFFNLDNYCLLFQSYACLCTEGFGGRHCEVNIDDCANQPCKNNGSCQDLVNGFSCDCSATGFTGPACEENINECLLSPCQNGAVCNDTLGDYSCKCQDTFCGKNCQRKDPCLEVGG